MSTQLKKYSYQDKAVDEVVKSVTTGLAGEYDAGYAKVLFKAPTGAGKTIMMARVIDRLVQENERPLSFVWVSVRSLAEQSRDKFERYIGGGAATFVGLDEVVDQEIKANQVLFFNWEKVFTKARRDNPDKDVKVGDYTNKFMRDNEWDRNLQAFCENTRANGRKVVLVIDESHTHLTANTQSIIDDIIKPAVRVDVTATPKNDFYNFPVEVSLQAVKDAEIIKKEVVINDGISKEQLEKSEASGDEIVFARAVEKRSELQALYDEHKSDVKPLVLIQLPNDGEKLSVLDKSKMEWAESYLADLGVTYENGKLAKWLTGKDKENIDDIEANDSEVQFLIFKQAIALGWDCPRAHILLKFREAQSETFEIQTVGRIMRMPELQHYQNDELDRAYVFANLLEIDIDQGALEYIKTKKALRKESYEPIDLPSVYLVRAEYNDLTLSYRNVLFDTFLSTIGGVADTSKADKNFKALQSYEYLGDGLNFDTDSITEGIIVDETVANIDKEQHIKADQDTNARLSDEDVERQFTLFLKQNCSPFQPARSHGILRTSLYQLFERYLAFDENVSPSRLVWQKLVLKNQPFFQHIILLSIQEYSKSRQKRQRDYRDLVWNVPREDFYPKNYINPTTSRRGKSVEKYDKCVMQPCWVSDEWKTEAGFIEHYLETHKNVLWWYKNGDAHKETYFAIPYTLNGKKRSFQPDFIVQYADGHIGIYDTKAGSTADSDETKAKVVALAKYIEKHNQKGRAFQGGIATALDDKYTKWQIAG